MRPAGDGGVVDAQAHPDLTGAPGEHGLPRRRERLAERLEREWAEQERAERARRERIERERAERERALRERRERRLRERREKLRREREALRRRPRRVRDSAGPGPPPAGRSTAARKQPSTSARTPPPAAGGTRPSATSVRIRPGVKGPVRKRVRSGENRRRVAARRRGLFWPTAKAGIAVSVVLALSAGLASVLGLAVPALDPGAGRQSLANSAALFGVDPGTPTGLSPGYVFPIVGPHDLGDKLARFGAPRYGHIHEGQDIFAKSGRPEVAVHDGVVVDRGTVSDAGDGGRGNYIAIYSPPDDRSFVYMHMLKPSRVQLGDQVHSGEVIGEVGCTGGCDGPHLHFEVRIGKATIGADTKPVDPLPYLRQWPQVTPG